MHPYKRRRRNRRDMITLGGWLFADLLLGLSMLFLVANTVGAPPPEPTPGILVYRTSSPRDGRVLQAASVRVRLTNLTQPGTAAPGAP